MDETHPHRIRGCGWGYISTLLFYIFFPFISFLLGEIRPHLEYAAPVWDPFTVNNVNKLENTQKFALRICTKQCNSGYQELLDLTNCPSLLNRRLYFKLCTLYRIVYDLVYFPPNVISPKHNSTCYFTSHLHVPLHITHLLFLLLYLYSIHSFKSSVTPIFLCP